MWRSPRARVLVALAFLPAALIAIGLLGYSLVIDDQPGMFRWGLIAGGLTFTFRAVLYRALYMDREAGWRSALLDALLPFALQKDVYANLDDLMPLWIAAHGQKRATRIRQVQIIRIVAGHYFTMVLEAVSRFTGIARGD